MKSKISGLVGVVAIMAGLATGYAQDAAPAAAPVTLSPAAAAVVSMAEGGQGDDAQLAYVQSSQSAFNLSADDVIYLRDVGLSSAVITAMLNHDKGTPAAPAYNYNQQAYPPTAAPPPDQSVPQPVAAPDAPPPTYVSDAPADVNYFYSGLQPYGAWVNLDGYGWCWQPRTVIINRGWRPYCDGGHWVWTDAGWFWQSDYSWGWAPFHYGRWVAHPRCGWVWFPDRVWAPAWVCWRSTGDYCGWAPLPLHADFVVGSGFRFNGVGVGVGFDFGLRAEAFTFVGLGDFGGRDYVRHRIAPVQVNQFWSKTTVINSYTVNNKIIVNRGIPVERVAAVTHKEIRPVAIRTAPAGSNIKVSSASSVVYRHEIQEPARPVKVVAQKIDDRHPTIQHTPVVSPVRATPNRPTPPPGQQTYQPGRGQKEVVTPPQHQTIEPGPSRGTGYTPPAHTTQVSPPANYYERNTTVTEPSTRAAQIPKPVERTYTPTLNPAPKGPTPLQGYSTPQPQQENSHFYNPKGYEQAQSAHTLPPLNQTYYANGHGQSTTSTAPFQSPKGSEQVRGGGPSQGQGQGQGGQQKPR